jgi:hypothetical protein
MIPTSDAQYGPKLMTSNTFALLSLAMLVKLTRTAAHPHSQRPNDGHHGRPAVLDELDACVLFLPQLQVAIDRRRDDEVRAVIFIRKQG